MSLFDLNGTNLVALASSISILISQEFNQEEIGVLSTIFSSIGDNLAILALSPLTDKDNSPT